MDRRTSGRWAHRWRWGGLVIVPVLAMLQGCLTVAEKSNEVANLNLRAHFTAESSPGSGVEITAQLQRAGTSPPVYLRLDGGDKLIAANGVSARDALSRGGGLFDGVAENSAALQRMRERFLALWETGFIDLSSDPEYYAIFPQPRRARPYYVTLERSVDQRIPDVEIVLPEPFELLAPAQGATFSRSQDLQVQWSDYGTSYAMELNIGALCEGSYGTKQSVATISLVSEGDTGLKQLSAAQMFDHAPLDATCAVTVALSRTRISTVPSAFGGGGSARGIEKRVVSFISVP